jgi:thymidylate synthase
LDIFRPKKVAYTIFPYGLYQNGTSQDRLYEKYTRYFKAVKHKLSWGTYFDRMIAYPGVNCQTNQLKNIVQAINTRKISMQAAYTIVIEIPGKETTRRMGAPCLNYLAVQIDNLENTLNLLATYRNHDFLQKAYGNYYGLCKLLSFLAKETKKKVGYLTCVSSHAYVDKNKIELLKFIREQ